MFHKTFRKILSKYWAKIIILYHTIIQHRVSALRLGFVQTFKRSLIILNRSDNFRTLMFGVNTLSLLDSEEISYKNGSMRGKNEQFDFTTVENSVFFRFFSWSRLVLCAKKINNSLKN